MIKQDVKNIYITKDSITCISAVLKNKDNKPVFIARGSKL